MKDSIKQLLKNFELGPCPSIESIKCLTNIDGISLPEDYVSFLSEADGGEGFVGAEYLILWKAGDLESFNRGYEVESYVKGLFLFGSSGDGEAFGFDTRCLPYKVIKVPFVGMDFNRVTLLADSFTEFLVNMERRGDALY